MRSNPTFAALAVLSLALGIGANAAVYSFIESIAFRKLPVTAPDSLVIMKWRSARGYYASTASAGFSFSTGGTQFLDGGGVIGSTFPYSALGLFQDSTDVLASAFSYFQDRRTACLITPRLELALSTPTRRSDAACELSHNAAKLVAVSRSRFPNR